LIRVLFCGVLCYDANAKLRLLCIVYVMDAQPVARGPDPAPEGVLSGPRSRLKKYMKCLLNDGDFTNELKIQ